MLTIQSGFSKTNLSPAFGRYDRDGYNTAPQFDDEDRFYDIQQKLQAEEDEYVTNRDFWENQKQTFDELAGDKDSVPSFLRKGMKVISVGISAVLGGMAMVWGSKKSIGAMESLANTKKVKAFTANTKGKFNKFKDVVGGAFQKIKNSKFVKSITNFINKKVDKFNNSKVGKNPIVKSIVNGVKTAKNWIVKSYNTVVNKIKGIKGETVKNTAVNTMGVSGGVTSGVAAMKENNAAEKEVE